MTELIKVIVSIKDPFTLLAFFAVVLLLAFKTKTVPESLFRLLGQKIGRDRFYQLLNRTLLFSFAVFLVLCGIAVLGQWLTYKTSARAASLEELKTELHIAMPPTPQRSARWRGTRRPCNFRRTTS